MLFRPNELIVTILNLCYTPACYVSDTILNNYTNIQDKGELDKKQAQSPRPKRIGPVTAYTCLDPKQAFVAPSEIYLHLRVESTSASEPIIFVIFFYPSVFFLLKTFFLPVKPVKICQVRLKQHTMQTTTPRQTRQPLQSQVIVKFHKNCNPCVILWSKSVRNCIHIFNVFLELKQLFQGFEYFSLHLFYPVCKNQWGFGGDEVGIR